MEKPTYARDRATQVVRVVVKETVADHLYARKETNGTCMALLALANGDAQRSITVCLPV